MSKTNQKTEKVRNTDPTKKKRVELWCSRMVDRSCFISDTRRVNHSQPVKNLSEIEVIGRRCVAIWKTVNQFVITIVDFFTPMTLGLCYFVEGIDIFNIGGRDRSWIYNYLCNQCLSPLTLWVRIPLRRGVLDTPLCYKVCRWLTAGRCFSPGTSVSSTNKTEYHDITEILVKVALNTITLTYLI